MKKLLSIAVIMLLLTGCSFGKKYMEEMAYYNVFISYVNDLTYDLDYAMDDYLMGVPEDINADTEIDFYGSYYGTAISNLDTAKDVLFDDEMVIENSLRQQNVEVAMNDFLDAFEYFFSMYNTAASFYSSDAYKDNVDSAYEMDGVTIEAYYAAAYAQLDLVNLIGEYQSEVFGSFDENTTNPVEKIGISISLLYDLTEEVVSDLSYWDFNNPDIEGLEEVYLELIAKHAEEEAEVAVLYNEVYKDLFDVFQINYLSVLTNFEEGVALLIEDAKAGELLSENSSGYDYIFGYYDELIELHNSVVDMMWAEY